MRGRNRLGDPICLRVGGLAAPPGTNMRPCGSTMQKMSKAGLPETKKLVQDTEKQRKACLESAQKRPSAEKERASFVRGSKNTGEHHRRAAGAPENRRRASEKTQEEQRTTSYTKTKEHTRYRNLCALIAFRWGGLPLSFIYIYILLCCQMCQSWVFGLCGPWIGSPN